MPSRPDSRAMRKLWDAGVYPHPADFSTLSIPWSPSHRGWTENWLRMLRHQSQQGGEELYALQRVERAQPEALEKSRQAAIARFHEGGELHRLLHSQSHQSTFTPTLRSDVPSRIEVTGGSPSIQELKVVLAGIADLEFRQEVDSVVVDGIRPADLLACLQAAARPPRKAKILLMAFPAAGNAWPTRPLRGSARGSTPLRRRRQRNKGCAPAALERT
jgi:hypothetical protein